MSYVLYENKQTIITAYSLLDTTKLIIYVSDKIGLMHLIKKKLTYTQPQMLLYYHNTEKCDLDDDTFDIINME